MTVAPHTPHSPLVERVKTALEQADEQFQSNPAIPHRSRHLARAALHASQAEELHQALNRLALAIRTQTVIVWTGELVEAAEDARVLLAKLESKP